MATWECDRGDCSIGATCGRGGGACVNLRSNATHEARAKSPLLADLQAGTLWLASVEVKCTVATSPPLLNVGPLMMQLYSGVHAETLPNGWERFEFLVRMPLDTSADGARVFVWQYHYDAVCSFGAVSASPADVAEFATTPYGPLGSNERVSKDGVYTAELSVRQSPLGSYHRCMKTFNATWETRNLIIANNDQVVLDYALKTPFLARPNITLNSAANFGVTLELFTSSDGGASWTHLLEVTGTGVFSAEFPSVSSTLLKFVGIGTSWYSVYLADIIFTAAVAPPPQDVIGREIIMAIDAAPSGGSQLSLSLSSSTGSTLNEPSDWNASLSFFVENSGSQSAAVSLSVVPRFSFTTAEFKDATLAVPAGQVSETAIVFHLAGGISQIADFSVSASGTKLFTGLLKFKPTHPLLDSSFGELLATSSSSDVWWCSSMYKISRFRKAPTATATGAITIKAARNEREPFQIVVKAKTSAVSVSAATISNLVSSSGDVIDAASSITVRQVTYVRTDVATDVKNGLPGAYWPDPLLPLVPFVCPANCNCPLWILVHVPGNTTAGTYSGSVSITVDGVVKTAPLQLVVWNVTIPKHTKLHSAFGINFWGETLDYYHINTTADKKKLYPLFLKSFEEHRISPYSPNLWQSYWADLRWVNGSDQWAFYSQTFEDHWRDYYGDEGYGFTSFTFSLAGLAFCNSGSTDYGSIQGTYNSYPWGSSEHTRLFTEYAIWIQGLFERLGLLDKAILYWYDEPDTTDYDFVRGGMSAIKSAAPKLQRFLTEEPQRELWGSVDAWCPVFYNFLRYNDLVKTRQAAGDKMWVYLAGCTKDNRLDMYIDRSMMDLRLWLWKVFAENVDGILVWDTVEWHNSFYHPNELQDPYEDTMSASSNTGSQFGNGDGRFFMPPPNWKTATSPIIDAPIETVRWEILRDGVEDWDLLTLLKETVASRELPSEIEAEAQDLLVLPETMFTSDKIYATEATELLARREMIAKLLEKIAITPDTPKSNGDNEDDDASAASQQKAMTIVAQAIAFMVALLM